jgi:hypothetical protein
VSGIADNHNGTLTLSFRGTPQAQYYVVSHTNAAAALTDWVPVAGSTIVVTNTSGLWNLTVPNSGPSRFYRSVAATVCP